MSPTSYYAPVDDALKVRDPVLVVDVLSPTTRARDAGPKLEDYFRLPSARLLGVKDMPAAKGVDSRPACRIVAITVPSCADAPCLLPVPSPRAESIGRCALRTGNDYAMQFRMLLGSSHVLWKDISHL